MPTLRQYYDTDFNRVMNVSRPLDLKADEETFSVQVHVHLDFDANVKFVSCYLPVCKKPLAVCANLLSNLQKLLEPGEGVLVQANLPGEDRMDSTALSFSGRIFFYSEAPIVADAFRELQKQARTNGLAIHYRGPEYASERTNHEHPLAFIAHDSRDKDAVARPIAYELIKLMCPVWFDEFSLKVGDKLRESIERGLKECRKCVLIVSPNFLGNSGWTKVEFNSIFTREVLEEKDLVLPVWKDVTKKQVYDYSPTLADRVAANWTLGSEEVARRLRRAIV
jgi:hypothetical protein